MKTTFLKLFFIATAGIMIQTGLKAQVTIGSGLSPNAGAILDLKEYYSKDPLKDASTSNRGMLLPRVKLINLTPATDEEFAASIGATGSWDRNSHIGLLVYNINEDFCTGGASIYKKPYIWDGVKWETLDDTNEASDPSVYSFIDSRDGQSYLARNFGDAGDWMLENLAYVPKDSDPGFSGFKEDPYTSLINKDSKLYGYPTPMDVIYTIGTIPDTWKKEYGILYSWHAATNDENISSAEQGQVDATEVPGPNEVETLFGKIRGICPEGWHLPSDREWNKLEKQIYNNISDYSCNKATDILTPSEWNTDWEWGTGIDGAGWRGSRTQVAQRWAMINAVAEGVPGHGNTMKLSIYPTGKVTPIQNDYVPEQKTYGRSFSAINGGFAVWLVGSLSGGVDTKPNSPLSFGYGGSAYFWTSSCRDSNQSSYVWARLFSAATSAVYRDNLQLKGRLNPVRCVKDK